MSACSHANSPKWYNFSDEWKWRARKRARLYVSLKPAFCEFEKCFFAFTSGANNWRNLRRDRFGTHLVQPISYGAKTIIWRWGPLVLVSEQKKARKGSRYRRVKPGSSTSVTFLLVLLFGWVVGILFYSRSRVASSHSKTKAEGPGAGRI